MESIIRAPPGVAGAPSTPSPLAHSVSLLSAPAAARLRWVRSQELVYPSGDFVPRDPTALLAKVAPVEATSAPTPRAAGCALTSRPQAALAEGLKIVLPLHKGYNIEMRHSYLRTETLMSSRFWLVICPLHLPTFATQNYLEMSKQWKATPLLAEPVQVFIGILSSANQEIIMLLLASLML